MEWSPEQDAALRKVRAWSRDPSGHQVFHMFGFAGSGKTTLARQIAEDHGGRVAFAAYTGKAALVLRNKGCSEATTIHQLIYNPKDRSRRELQKLENELVELHRRHFPIEDTQAKEREIEAEKEKLRQPTFALNYAAPIIDYDLVIIDEVSMVDGRIGEDLLSFGIPILVLGDPAQLPPVKGTGFFMSNSPEVMLTEVHRQARDNPIIELATRVREGLRLELGSYGESKVIPKRDLEQGDVIEADQVIVGKNATRTAYNQRIRQLTGRDHPVPMPSDKLVCLRNEHDLGLLNGAIWYAGSIAEWDEDHVVMDVTSDDDGKTIPGLDCHMSPFMGDETKKMWWERQEKYEFTYGYALTAHKSQGSQWNNVCVFDESSVFRADSRKWLYTAITRAANKLTLVR